MPERMSRRMPDRMPERTSEFMPERNHPVFAQKVCQNNLSGWGSLELKDVCQFVFAYLVSLVSGS